MDDNDKLVQLDKWQTRWHRNEILQRRRRIRRPLKLGWEKEEREDRRYPYTLDCGLPVGHKVVFRRSGWRKVGFWFELDEGQEPVRIRETFAWIEYQGQRVGAVGLTEIDGSSVLPREFWEQLDDDSFELARWAYVLLSAWPELTFDVLGYGQALELEIAWVHPLHPHRGIWKPVAHELIRRVMPRCSILVAHCFPLEYTGCSPPGAASMVGFERRQAALMRTCEREFGLRPFPGNSGEKGFMWKPKPEIARYLDEPVYSQEWLDE